jgi:3',5'-nucleoside bisphosphate phosphatase
MRYEADLHIHSVLSPCADFLMTMENIFTKLKENNIKIFSITDHNSCGNSRQFMKRAEKEGVLFIPGIEIQTAEEIHITAYFKTIEELENIAEAVLKTLPNIENREEIYGYQLILDESDDYCEKELRFLTGASSMGIDDIYSIIKKNNGIFIPAHIDRSNSLISNIGYFPKFNYDGVEIYNISKARELIEKYDIKYPVFSNSDAHFIEQIGKAKISIEMDKLTIEEFFLAVKNKKVYMEV